MDHPTVLACSLLALALTGCAQDAPPTIAYDEAEPAPALQETPPPIPVKIVPVPEPLPLPGQLRTIRQGAPTETAEPLEQVADQRESAMLGPADAKTINAITVYPFVEGALYQLYAAPEQITDIALQPGERLKSVAAGDTVRWVVGDTASGAGAEEQVHVLVKPFAADLSTNLVILTDRRAYHLALASSEDPAMSAIAWTYPHDELLALTRESERAAAQMPVETGLDLEALRFRYRIDGDTQPWRPHNAFDDGSKVYIQFPERIDQGEMPPLFVLGEGGKAELVNYRVRRNYYIVDRLFAAAELRLGEDPQAVVRILRTDQGEEGPAPRTTMPDRHPHRER
jgi:P-type conjugative transfer protein TrbG